MPELMRIDASTPFGEIRREVMEWYQLTEEAARNLYSSFEGVDDCLRFATEIGLKSPADFCGKIYVLASGEFPVIDIAKRVSATGAFKRFSDFASGVLERLKKEPLSPQVLKQLGVSQRDVIAGMESALQFARDEQDLVMMLNSITPEFGKKLFSEWVLAERKKERDK
jgi:hypothetical protein